jgi:hypothetical protein
MSKIKLTGSNSGYVEIDSAADAGNLTLTLPTSGVRLLSNTDNVFSGITTTGELDINGKIDVSTDAVIARNLSVGGITTHTGTTTLSDDVTFTGASYNVLWDKSDNQLEFADNAKISFGGSSDLQIYHDGNRSIISDTGTGELRMNGSAIQLRDTAQNFMINATANDSVDLYFNQNKKFETTNTGAIVTGICTATSFSGSGEGLTYTSPLSHRNRIINGAMMVAQRGTSFLSSASASQYTLDRFRVDVFPFGGTSGAATITQSANAPAGFSHSLKVDITATDTSLVGNNYSQVSYQLERQDVRPFAYGGSNAKPITLSFYVRSNKTGNYNVHILQYGNSTRLASFTYTINSANTWERKTITIPADTSGNIVDGTASGFNINFGLAYGGNYTTGTNQTSFGSYVAANSGVGQAVNLYDSASNEWYLSGVQLEIGSVATPFEHRSFGEELSRCQRYYYTTRGGSVGNPNSDSAGFFGVPLNNNPSAYGTAKFAVPMRATPTVVLYDGTATAGKFTQNGNNYFPGTAGGVQSNGFNLVTRSSGYLSDDANLTVTAGFTANAEL